MLRSSACAALHPEKVCLGVPLFGGTIILRSYAEVSIPRLSPPLVCRNHVVPDRIEALWKFCIVIVNHRLKDSSSQVCSGKITSADRGRTTKITRTEICALQICESKVAVDQISPLETGLLKVRVAKIHANQTTPI
jgi:hypothetical protein